MKETGQSYSISFFFSSRRRHTRFDCDWSSDVCSSDLFIPTGTLVHNVELKPGKGGQLARSAGSGIQLVAKDEGYGVLRLPSGETRRVPLTCRPAVGHVGNVDHQNVSGGTPGRSRSTGKR